MTPLIIILSVLALLVILCFLPVSAKLGYDGDFTAVARLAGIKVYDSSREPKKEKKTKTQKESKGKDTKKQENQILSGLNFKRLTKKHGFVGAVKRLMSLVGRIFTHIKKLLRHIKFRKTKLKIVVSAENAADTAIYYGDVCAAVYPVLTLIDSNSDISFDKVDISADFTLAKPSFAFETVIVTRVLYLILGLFGAYSEYKKFLDEEEQK